MRFEVHADPRCLRGLRFVYTAPGLVPDHLVARLRDAYPHHLVEGHERWGERTVQRLIVQFRFELQLGARADEVGLLHRVTATPSQRAADRAQVEVALYAALEAS